MKKDKKTKSKASPRFQGHFRKFQNAKFTGHPQYIYADDGKLYKVIGITSSPVTNGVGNIPLDKNPEPKNTKKAYLRPKPDSVSKGTRNKKLKGWKFSDSDKKKVRSIIETHDKKKN